MKKVVITDLDDTLYSWLNFFIPAFYAMVDEVVSITGLEESVLLNEYKEKHQMYGSVEYPYATLKLPSILNKYQGLKEEEIKTVLGEAFHKFNSIRKAKLELFPNVFETLKKLTEAGVKIIGYTDSAEENGYYRLKRLDIEQFFYAVYVCKSEYICEYPSSFKIRQLSAKKPNKDVLYDICRQEGIDLSEAVYVGDSLTKDMYMAREAGITSVWMQSPITDKALYAKLDAISSWTDEETRQNEALSRLWTENSMKPDYEIDDYSKIIDIVMK